MNKQNKILSKLLLLSLAVFFTSCINIFEHVKFNNNGSGTYTFTVDMGNMVKMYAAMGVEMTGDEIFEDLDLEEPEMIYKLEAVEGISNVQPVINKEDISVSLSFDFEDVDALNAGISTYMHDSTESPDVIIKTFYEWKGRDVIRTSQNPILESFQSEISEEDLNNPMMKAMMGDMSYIQKITVNSGINKFDNEEYIRLDENTIEWQSFFFDPEKYQTNISVNLKRGK